MIRFDRNNTSNQVSLDDREQNFFGHDGAVRFLLASGAGEAQVNADDRRRGDGCARIAP